MKLIALLALSTTAFAGKAIVAPTTEPEPRGYFQLDGAVGDHVWSGRTKFGIISPLSGIGLLADKGGKWQLRLGLDYERFEFDRSLALPSRLQRASGVVALEYRAGRQVAVLIEARPGVYFENDIGSNAWNCPVLFGVGIPINDGFALAVAVRYNPFAENQVIGGPGFVWKINDRLTFVAVPPEPRLTWAATDALDLWLGGEIAGGVFRTDTNTLVDYSDYRAGIGATWRQGPWTLEAGAGVSFEQEWDFHQLGTTVSADKTAPFFKLALRTDW